MGIACCGSAYPQAAWGPGGPWSLLLQGKSDTKYCALVHQVFCVNPNYRASTRYHQYLTSTALDNSPKTRRTLACLYHSRECCLAEGTENATG